MKPRPKYKTGRRLGSSVYEKCQTEKFALREARKSKGRFSGRRRNMSEYNKQLLEKQKVRITYGVNERQFRKYVSAAMQEKGAETGSKLAGLLESRLDNVVYRSGLAPTRRAARQLVSHGYILVNGRKTKIPSYSVSKGDNFSVRESVRDRKVFSDRAEEIEKHKLPAWISYDYKKYEGKISGVPSKEDIDATYDLSLVLEFYSR